MKTNQANIHLSRAFVEFGPITLEEFHTFVQRGILKESDYLRKDGEEDWLHVSEFAAAHPLSKVAKPRAATKKTAPAKKKAATKKTPVKKAKSS